MALLSRRFSPAEWNHVGQCVLFDGSVFGVSVVVFWWWCFGSLVVMFWWLFWCWFCSDVVAVVFYWRR